MVLSIPESGMGRGVDSMTVAIVSAVPRQPEDSKSEQKMANERQNLCKQQ